MLAPPFWPRLYLDTADLIDIADGRTDDNLVTELTTACEAHLVILVVSGDHFTDMLRPDDLAWVDRLVAAFERFRLRGFVMRGPLTVEPWAERGVAQDIEVSGWGNVREVLTAPEATPQLGDMREVQDTLEQERSSRGLSPAA